MIYKKVVLASTNYVLVDFKYTPALTIKDRYKQFLESCYYYYGNKARTMTDYMVARAIGYNQATLSLKKKSFNDGNGLDIIYHICKRFGCNMAWFFNQDKGLYIPLFSDASGTVELPNLENCLKKQLLTV